MLLMRFPTEVRQKKHAISNNSTHPGSWVRGLDRYRLKRNMHFQLLVGIHKRQMCVQSLMKRDLAAKR